jgi:hypothetical protein
VALTCDETTTLDNQSWIFVYHYCVQNWSRILLFPSIECFLEALSDQNLMKLIIYFLFNVGGCPKVEVPSRLLCIGTYGVNTFQGAHGRVTIEIQNLHAHFFTRIHYIAHKKNLRLFLICLWGHV